MKCLDTLGDHLINRPLPLFLLLSVPLPPLHIRLKLSLYETVDLYSLHHDSYGYKCPAWFERTFTYASIDIVCCCVLFSAWKHSEVISAHIREIHGCYFLQ